MAKKSYMVDYSISDAGRVQADLRDLDILFLAIQKNSELPTDEKTIMYIRSIVASLVLTARTMTEDEETTATISTKNLKKLYKKLDKDKTVIELKFDTSATDEEEVALNQLNSKADDILNAIVNLTAALQNDEE